MVEEDEVRLDGTSEFGRWNTESEQKRDDRELQEIDDTDVTGGRRTMTHRNTMPGTLKLDCPRTFTRVPRFRDFWHRHTPCKGRVARRRSGCRSSRRPNCEQFLAATLSARPVSPQRGRAPRCSRRPQPVGILLTERFRSHHLGRRN